MQSQTIQSVEVTASFITSHLHLNGGEREGERDTLDELSSLQFYASEILSKLIQITTREQIWLTCTQNTDWRAAILRLAGKKTYKSHDFLQQSDFFLRQELALSVTLSCTA